MLNFVFAEEIEINLIEYHPDSYYTRLQIRNNAGRDLNDLNIKVGDNFETSSEGVFKNGVIYNAILGIPPGEHQVTVTTREGVTSSKLVYFSLSKEDVQEEILREQESAREEQELQQTAQKNLEEAQRQIEIEREKAIELGVIKDRKYNPWIITAIAILVVGIIILFWLRRRGKEE